MPPTLTVVASTVVDEANGNGDCPAHRECDGHVWPIQQRLRSQLRRHPALALLCAGIIAARTRRSTSKRAQWSTRPTGSAVLVPWFTVPSVAGAGYNREKLSSSSALYAGTRDDERRLPDRRRRATDANGNLSPDHDPSNGSRPSRRRQRHRQSRSSSDSTALDESPLVAPRSPIPARSTPARLRPSRSPRARRRASAAIAPTTARTTTAFLKWRTSSHQGSSIVVQGCPGAFERWDRARALVSGKRTDRDAWLLLRGRRLECALSAHRRYPAATWSARSHRHRCGRERLPDRWSRSGSRPSSPPPSASEPRPSAIPARWVSAAAHQQFMARPRRKARR